MKLHIKNYQTIKDITLDIKGFTCIVGKSNTGKTAVLRACEGAMFNDPVSNKVRHGSTSTEVTVSLPDIKWTWTKGGGQNDYLIQKDGRKIDYSSVGRKVPTEIKDAGFREWAVDKTKIRPQVAAWHQPIFLLNSSGKVVTELITSVTRLDVVNKAIRNCAIEMRRNKQKINLRETDLKSTNRNVNEFDALALVPAAEIDLLWDKIRVGEHYLLKVGIFLKDLAKLDDSLAELEHLENVGIPITLDATRASDIKTLQTLDIKYTEVTHNLNQLNALDDVTVPTKINIPLVLGQMESWLSQVNLLNSRLTSLLPLDDVNIPDPFQHPTEMVQMRQWLLSLKNILVELKEFSELTDVTIPSKLDTQVLREMKTVAKWYKSLKAFDASISPLDTLNDVDMPQNATTVQVELVASLNRYLEQLSRLSGDLDTVCGKIDGCGSTLEILDTSLQAMRLELGECSVCGKVQ